MPKAVRVDDQHVCTQTSPAPHKGGPVLSPGAAHVFIGYAHAARKTDPLECTGVCDRLTNTISEGEEHVLIENLPAARVGHKTAHKGFLQSGCQTVTIGSANHGAALRTARPFGERCRTPDGQEKV